MLKAGIIGLGVGEAHIEGYLSHKNCIVTSLCDFNDKVYNKIKKKYPNYKITKNSDEILNDPEIDIVSIASYDNYHYEQIIKGIKNNKHLFIEKPICLFEWQAKDILNALKKKPDIKISSNLIMRRYERFINLKNRIKTGEMGELSHIMGGYNYGRLLKITEGWRGEIDYYSIVHGGGVHIIDLILWLTSDRIIEVYAIGNNIKTKNTKFKYNDMVAALLKFESGMTGVLSCNFGCVYPHFHQLEVYGTKATFINELNNAVLYKSRDTKNYNQNKKIRGNKNDEYTGFQNLNDSYRESKKGDHLKSFIDSILNDSKPEVNQQEIFDVMAVCFAIEKSINSSSVEKVNYLE